MRRNVGSLVTFLVLAELLALGFLVSRTPPPGDAGDGRLRVEGSSSLSRLRRCLPLSGRDARFATTDICVTAPERLQAFVELLRVLGSELEGANVGFWIDGGVLLGQKRAGVMSVWDAGVDVGILSSGYEALQNQVLLFPPGYELNALNSVLYPRGECDEDTPVRLVDTRFGFFVGIRVFEELDDQEEDGDQAAVKMLGPPPSKHWIKCVECREVSPNTAKRSRMAAAKQLAVPREWILPLQLCALHDVEVYCPHEADLYLAHIYGDELQTSD